MDGKDLTCTTRVWQTPNRIDSCRNQAITTHDSGLAGLGSGGVTGYAEVIPGDPIRAITSGLPTIRKLSPGPRIEMEGTPLLCATSYRPARVLFLSCAVPQSMRTTLSALRPHGRCSWLSGLNMQTLLYVISKG